MPAIKAGRKRKNPASPVLAALPVVCSTNHGRAIIVSVLPTSEIVFALSSARSGARRAGDVSVMVVSRFIGLFPTLRRSPLEVICNLVRPSRTAFPVVIGWFRGSAVLWLWNRGTAEPAVAAQTRYELPQPLLVHTQCAKLLTAALDALEDQVTHRHHHAHKDHEDR